MTAQKMLVDDEGAEEVGCGIIDSKTFESLLNTWSRPPLFQQTNKRDEVNSALPLDIQLVDTSSYISHRTAPSGLSRACANDVSTRGSAVVKLFGVTANENSVLVHVHGFQAYFYIDSWPGITLEQANDLKLSLNRQLDSSANACVRAEIVQRRSLYGYDARVKTPDFIRLIMASPTLISAAARCLKQGFQVQGEYYSSDCYETKVPFELRFMVDRHIVGGGWIRIPHAKYSVRSASECISQCQLEVDCWFDEVSGMENVGEFMLMAPLRVLSFDIECAARKSTFPTPDIDPVIQISMSLQVHGRERSANDINAVLCLRDTGPVPGAQVVCFQHEHELLQAFQRALRSVDPDILTGYNIVNFDLPYLLDRAVHLKVDSFELLGRTTNERTVMRDTTFTSSAYGTRESKSIAIDGRVQLDILQIVQREYKLRSYSLNSVSAHFLQQQKEDVHHSIITDLFNASPQTRQRLAVYCLKDALLPLRLMKSLLLLVNYVEMARVTGVPISFLLSRGQQIKVVSQLLRKGREHGFIIPNRPREEDAGYEGATVLEPMKGYYNLPIATLDFSSLYPSIMMAHNLCYSTLVHPSQVASLHESSYTRTPTGDVFVKPAVKKGLLPVILEELLDARKRAKIDMKQAKDPLTKDVLNGRQLALKISANSVYGFTGATVGQLPCLAISSSVTSFGRKMIDQSKLIVESTFNREKGYQHDAIVIYGDTDSVMIKFGIEDMSEVMILAKKAAEIVTNQFLPPIRLEFEKVYFPYLLMNKKRYAGLYWTKADHWDKMDAKGIETVRRDSCSLVKTVVEECLKKILIDRNPQSALEFTRGMISSLLRAEMDMSQLVITKQLGKDPNEALNRSAHTELAKRMALRDPATAPSVGDRVAYVMTRGSKKAKAWEKAEDPMFVLEHGIPIDTQYYLEHQLKLPLQRIFEPILGDANKLFSGEHMRSIKVSTPKVGGLMKFAVVRDKCLGCKVPLEKHERAVCQHCVSRLPDVYDHYLQTYRSLEKMFGKLWVQCQRCQGSLHQDVICSSRDCPIFYRRKKVQKDLDESRNTLERLQF